MHLKWAGSTTLNTPFTFLIWAKWSKGNPTEEQ